MINIEHLEESQLPLLKDFSAREWPSVDKEHYGDREVDFTKCKFALAAKEGTTMLGYITLMFDMGVLHMDSLIEAEAHRGKGIATKLAQAAEEKGKSMGAHKIWLETGKDWSAKNFYEKRGYQVRANLDNYYAHQDFVLMDKEL